MNKDREDLLCIGRYYTCSTPAGQTMQQQQCVPRQGDGVPNEDFTQCAIRFSLLKLFSILKLFRRTE